MKELVKDEETLRQLQVCGAIFCTQEEAAAVLGTSSTKLAAFLKANPDAEEVWKRGQMTARVSLRRKQYNLADRNVGMAIWLGLQYLGQTRDPEVLKAKELEGDVPKVPAAAKLTKEEKREFERLLAKAAGNDAESPAGDDAFPDPEGVGARESA